MYKLRYTYSRTYLVMAPTLVRVAEQIFLHHLYLLSITITSCDYPYNGCISDILHGLLLLINLLLLFNILLMFNIFFLINILLSCLSVVIERLIS